MEPHERPSHDTEPIDYQAPRILDVVDVEAQLIIPNPSLR